MEIINQPIFIALLSIITIILLFNLIWYGRLSIYLNKQRKETFKSNLPPISIIIAARNEAENLMELIPKLFRQEYENFEVIVVDDCSYDNTQDVLIALEAKYPNLKKTFVKESNKFQGGKKFALTIGIKSAKNEHLVFTDADCVPSSNQWLKHFGNSFAKGNDLVIGYGGFLERKSIVNLLFRVDTLQIALDYITAIVWKIPYMAVGRNLGYTKKLFFENKGFAKHAHLKSGDDDLFVNEVANKAMIGLLLHPDAITFSETESSFSKWFLQKKRHVSTFKFYPFSKKILLGLLFAFRLLIYVSIVYALVVFPNNAPIFIGLFFTMWLIRLLVTYLPAKSMKTLNSFWWLPAIEPIIICLQIIFPIIKQFDKEISWKH